MLKLIRFADDLHMKAARKAMKNELCRAHIESLECKNKKQ